MPLPKTTLPTIDEDVIGKPSTDEYVVANWMKKNVDTKMGKQFQHNVEFFNSNTAIDALLSSKFAKKDNPLFTTREQVQDFLNKMLEHKFFQRAITMIVNLEETKDMISNETTSNPSSVTEAREGAKAMETTKDDTESEQIQTENSEIHAIGTSDTNDSNNGCGDMQTKTNFEIQLVRHPKQIIVDGSEAYVWIYSPYPASYWLFGLIILLGLVILCLFPLWPATPRKLVYYTVIIAGISFFLFLGLSFLRVLIFAIVWTISGGKFHLWILPNLSQDLGYIGSVRPLYVAKYPNQNESVQCSNEIASNPLSLETESMKAITRNCAVSEDENSRVGPRTDIRGNLTQSESEASDEYYEFLNSELEYESTY